MRRTLTEIAGVIHHEEFVLLGINLEEISMRDLPLHSSDIEQSRSIVNERGRTLFITRRFAVRRILAVVTGCASLLAPMEWAPSGKPSLPDSLSKRIRFSYSSSGFLLCLALSKRGEIGCDIERDNSCFNDDDFSRSFLSRREARRLEKIEGSSQRAFAARAAWVAKEAYLKWLGTGLSKEPSSTEILLNWDSVYERWLCSPQLRFFHIPDSPQHTLGAVCGGPSFSEESVQVTNIDPGTLLT
jgi:phosphopantetheinyl transferase